MRRRLPALLLLIAAALVGGCDGQQCEDDVDPHEECGLACDESDALEAGNLAFGSAILDPPVLALVRLEEASLRVERDLLAELRALARLHGVPEDGDADDLIAAIVARHETGVGDAVDGSFRIRLDAPRCATSLARADEAVRICLGDGAIEPIEPVTCDGECVVAPAAQAACAGSGGLTCTGVATDCAGTCASDCFMELGAICPATCIGTCEGSCDHTATDGSCLGRCDGECIGHCELAPGQSCPTACEGSCSLDAAGGCPGGMTGTCTDASAAGVRCEGPCIGRAVPPAVRPGCRIAVQVGAAVGVTCTEPRAVPLYRLAGGLGPEQSVRFRSIAQREATLLARAAATAHPIHGRAARLEIESQALIDGVFAELLDEVEALDDAPLSLRERFLLDCTRPFLEEQIAAIEAIDARLELALGRYAALEAGLGGEVP